MLDLKLGWLAFTGTIMAWGLRGGSFPFFLAERGERGRVSTTQALASQLGKACEEFRIDHGRSPWRLEDLAQRPSYVSAEKWPVGGSARRIPQDGWGREFSFRCDAEGFVVGSLGADGEPGGEDDKADILVRR